MRRAILRWTKRAALVGCAVMIALFVARAIESQRGPPLEPWHVFVPADADAAALDRMNWDDWLALEQRVFDSVRHEVSEPLGREGIWMIASWGGRMLAGAVQIALPAATALLVANIAFGVMSRAAPTLNLFAVGLPAGLLLGFVILLLNLGHLSTLLAQMLQSTLEMLTSALQA